MGVKCDFNEIYALVERAKRELSQAKVEKVQEKIVNEALARHVRRTVEATPVDSGELRRSWSTGIKPARFEGRVCIARLSNALEYASYVEYGHRTRNGRRWVKGRFMMSKSLGKVKRDLKCLAERELTSLLGGAINGK